MSLGAEKVIIRHSSTGRDNVGILEIKKKKRRAIFGRKNFSWG